MVPWANLPTTFGRRPQLIKSKKFSHKMVAVVEARSLLEMPTYEARQAH